MVFICCAACMSKLYIQPIMILSSFHSTGAREGRAGRQARPYSITTVFVDQPLGKPVGLLNIYNMLKRHMVAAVVLPNAFLVIS